MFVIVGLFFGFAQHGLCGSYFFQCPPQPDADVILFCGPEQAAGGPTWLFLLLGLAALAAALIVRQTHMGNRAK